MMSPATAPIIPSRAEIIVIARKVLDNCRAVAAGMTKKAAIRTIPISLIETTMVTAIKHASM